MYKVLIADDEKSIRDGIVKLIEWESLGCKVIGEFHNGKEVLDFLMNNEVDIIVTDIKMPLIDGIELVKQVRKQYAHISTIILSAYSEFEYAKKALKYEVSDYIIKNKFIQELPKAIEAIIEKLEKENKQGITEINTKLELLADVILGVNNHLSIRDNYLINEYYIGYIGTNDKHLEENVYYILNKLFTINFEEIEYYLVEIKQGGYLIILEIPVHMKEEIVEHKFLALFDMLGQFTSLAIKVGLAKWDNRFESLKGCYEKSQDVYKKIREKGNTLALYKQKVVKDDYINLEDYLNSAIEFVRQYKKEEVTTILEEMITKMSASDKSFNTIKVDIIAFCSGIIRRVTRYANQDIITSIEETIYTDINMAETIVQLEDIGTEVIKIALSIKTSQKDKLSLADSVNEFIENHYAENISLTQLSHMLYVNGSYLSRVYKKQTGLTITGAINKYRVDKAKELLKREEYKVYEVAKMVGIEDPAYFTNVFMKYEGSSPKEYKNKYTV